MAEETRQSSGQAFLRLFVHPRPRVRAGPGAGVVTLQELRQDDADTYWCGIEKPGTDLGTQIKVTVVPRSQASRTRNTSRPAASSRPHSRTHYMLLAFLKMPFLLGLVGAVLWLEERRRDVVEPQGQPIYANLSSELLTRDTRV
ncbi:CMRF35-like molecule 7 isoform 3-T3 [Dama dama]|uniref:CMRF35-like molecule 7 isoform X3 n=1 Tax=Dama dama TaxID=30532 RepID=UPI002A3687A1|nr:CMRF35-like molecule 7 isoform X3 [Dama dama]